MIHVAFNILHDIHALVLVSSGRAGLERRFAAYSRSVSKQLRPVVPFHIMNADQSRGIRDRIILLIMNRKRYEEPKSRAVASQWEANFCESYPSVSISFGDGGGSGGGTGDDFFDDEIQW